MTPPATHKWAFRPRFRRHAIGTAVNHAIETCAGIIAEAPVDDETRDR